MATTTDVLLALDDHRLVAHVARVVGVPRAHVEGDRFSFVLHAPLELLARAALLPMVRPAARERARRRLVVLADEYERSGPPLPPAPVVEHESAGAAADVLARAATEGDATTADAAATWLGTHVRADELVGLLGDAFLPSLEAAGHANIYLALLARTRPRGLPGQMLRHPAHAVVADSPRAIHVPPTRVRAEGEDDAPIVARLVERLLAVRPIGPPPSSFIAPLVAFGEEHHVLGDLHGPGAFEAPARPPFLLLRFAAQAMLQGPADQAPYGWTHGLTLAQAPLLLAAAGADPGRATYVALTYLAAHWAGHGRGALDLARVPAPRSGDLHDALLTDPERAAAIAWHAPDADDVAALLATVASLNHDAHRVKYTLACLDAAACDPSATRLYLAAAAYLNAWWHQHGDPSDPDPGLALPSDVTPAMAAT